MHPVIRPRPYICTQCLRSAARRLSISARRNNGQSESKAKNEKEQGAMSRRLEDMSERNLEEAGRSARKAVEEAGFNEDLKKQLLDRLEGAKFKEDNIRAFAHVNTPASAGKGTRDIAAAQAWTGEESVEDASLRMLDDSYKKIRTPSRIPSPQRPPKRIDTGRPGNAPSTGARLANARDRTSMYAYLKDENLSEKEKEQMRKELKERFSPGARAAPTTLRGLESLANERIEDAIARGQFKNLPRGQKLERDYNMSSPFLDTTEYFLNKMIKKQEIVPPWIEKQQELVSTANKFRSRLRVEWRRHAARLIASRGGPLESQIRRAEEYAAAEAIVNPPRKKLEQVNTVDKDGHMSQITLAGELQPAKDGASEGVTNIQIVEEPMDPKTGQPEDAPPSVPGPTDVQQEVSPDAVSLENSRIVGGAVFPFRDPAWESTERSYHVAAIDNLNNLTRSYNLMAPDLAKKPYYNLDRELRACYADVAPQLADAIRERAFAPKPQITVLSGGKPGSVLESFTTSSARVYDEQRPQYGFKEFWKDLFSSKQAS